MTSLADRPNCALVIIDVQRDVVADAHTTEDPSQYGAPLNAEQVIAHTNLYWSYSAAPGRSGRAVPTAEVDFA